MDKKYTNYLKSDKWKGKAELIKQTFESCSMCGSKENLNVHHKNYNNLYNEKLTDLILLCNKCHGKYHNKYSHEQHLNNKKDTDKKKRKLPKIYQEIRDREEKARKGDIYWKLRPKYLLIYEDVKRNGYGFEKEYNIDTYMNEFGIDLRDIAKDKLEQESTLLRDLNKMYDLASFVWFEHDSKECEYKLTVAKYMSIEEYNRLWNEGKIDPVTRTLKS